MARARLLKPGFFTNPELGALPFEARLLFAGLWTIADREGRLQDRPQRIRAEVFPFDDLDCDELLQQLHEAGLIVRYRVDDAALIAVPTWVVHQQCHRRESAINLPPPEPGSGLGMSKGEPGSGLGMSKGEPGSGLGMSKAEPGSGLGMSKAEPGSGLGMSKAAGIRYTVYGSGIKRASRATRAREAEPPDPEPPNPEPPDPEPPNPEPPTSNTATPEAAVCLALRRAGIARVNPAHPTLHALVAAGAEPQEFLDAASGALGKAHPFAYVLGVVEGRRRDALNVANGTHTLPPDPEAWRDTHDGVLNRANNLGLERWDQGITEDWHTFRRRVIAAHEARAKGSSA
jgi:hypothetical protein